MPRRADKKPGDGVEISKSETFKGSWGLITVRPASKMDKVRSSAL